ncbi:GRP-2 [Symbiodinium necroappetens]|uniref:GRP-2 protein n=1 Tax=Symbiodinium necroappetens TaxID=1628268 RepID=A0A812PJB6_9DINO|nr:GRP-2 [Symbiodinium necroappetens]
MLRLSRLLCDPRRGTVIMFGNGKSYGFIAPDAGGPDIFVHKRWAIRTAFPRRVALKEGERVEFELQPDRSPCHLWRSAANAMLCPAALDTGAGWGLLFRTTGQNRRRGSFCTGMQRLRPDHDLPGDGLGPPGRSTKGLQPPRC